MHIYMILHEIRPESLRLKEAQRGELPNGGT
jgi:hypothetical protein